MNNNTKAPIKKENGVSIPEGYKETKCAMCGSEYYVPAEIIDQDTAFVCPDCVAAKANAVSDTKAAATASISQ